jgi:hypothetical protein
MTEYFLVNANVLFLRANVKVNRLRTNEPADSNVSFPEVQHKCDLHTP